MRKELHQLGKNSVETTKLTKGGETKVLGGIALSMKKPGEAKKIDNGPILLGGPCLIDEVEDMNLDDSGLKPCRLQKLKKKEEVHKAHTHSTNKRGIFPVLIAYQNLWDLGNSELGLETSRITMLETARIRSMVLRQ